MGDLIQIGVSQEDGDYLGNSAPGRKNNTCESEKRLVWRKLTEGLCACKCKHQGRTVVGSYCAFFPLSSVLFYTFYIAVTMCDKVSLSK